MWAVVPVKALHAAKTRLASSLDAETRQSLQRALLVQTLEATGACRSIERTVVVTRDLEAQRLAARAGALPLEEPHSNRPDREGALNAALDSAARYSLEQGARSLLVLPGDLPCLDEPTLDELISRFPTAERAAAIVSDRHGDGTNALFCKPPTLLRFAFGLGSAKEHLRRARAVGAEVTSLEHPDLGLDLDTPDDLEALRQRGAVPTALRDLLQVGSAAPANRPNSLCY